MSLTTCIGLAGSEPGGVGYAEADRVLARIAAGQCGLVSRAQCLKIGLGPRPIKYRLSNGRLEEVLPGVYRIAGSAPGLLQELWATILWLGDGSAVSHVAAAARWHFDGFSAGTVEISTINHKNCYQQSLASKRRMKVHRVDEHLISEITQIENLPVTSVRRTLLDLCGTKDPRSGRLLDQGLRLNRLDLGDTWLYLEQEWMRGRRGVRILKGLLAERTLGRAPNDSDLELELSRMLRENGLPDPTHQYPVVLPQAVVHVDLAYPSMMLAIEVDSYSWHMDRDAFERDRSRDNELRALGWTVFRFTWAMIRYQPHRVIELISAHLGAECASRAK